ncbi:MAG: AraC family transcriptional regulator [Mesorhizobium sp. SCN 65-12]|nr:MAG: AraC family transcriptional regulator [Mesorhizobium sp. SCN 65-12]
MLDAFSENLRHQRGVARDDVLSAVLATIRLSGSLQFCFMPTGEWQTDGVPRMAAMSGRPGGTMPFHVLASGSCWLRIGGEELELSEGDIVMFPFGTGHQLGVGLGGRLLTPILDLPPRPWREIPVLRYGAASSAVTLLCGYLQCEGVSFAPLKQVLPELIHIRTSTAAAGDWLRTTVRQMVAEVDSPRVGGVSMLPRLTEIMFIEILRHQILAADPRATGWLAALADALLSRCLSLIHDDPGRDWSLEELSAACGVSRSVLAERFQKTLGTSPIRYVREWRLYLASVALTTTGRTIAAIAFEAGYATEAAFNRAFSQAFGAPPATWRAKAQS